MEFTCPCKENKHQNASFVAAYFIIPAFLAFVLMFGFHVSSKAKKCSDDCLKICNCIIPSIVWMILLFFDGRYFACGSTDWSGRYVTADKAAPVKWCETNNKTSYEERLNKSQEWYFHSQCIGVCITLVMAIVALGVFIYKCIKNTTGDEPENSGLQLGEVGSSTNGENGPENRSAPENSVEMSP
ncbi:uncharacterized protein LOC115793402 isoform X2 [Archocentrus centrarchus]|nr:uncharacterized protein LOC115793402 isoform X2 [Archocentrus centrarchus]